MGDSNQRQGSSDYERAASSGRRWALAVLFFFMLFHQADKFLVAPLTTPIMETFGIGEDLMGLTATAAIVVGIAFLPMWGYLGDRLPRPAVISAASAIWGITTAASAVAPSYRYFLLARASTGIDDDAYPAVRSLVADYYPPRKRAAVYGILAATAPVGYLAAVLLAILLRGPLGWRGLYFLTGLSGIVMAVLVALRVKEVHRGESDEAALRGMAAAERGAESLAGAESAAPFDSDRPDRFEWAKVRRLVRRPTFLILVAQGFFGVFPWNVIAFWFFRYLETERGLSEGSIFLVMASAIGAMTLGNLAGGWLGDRAASRFAAGRMAVSMVAVLTGAALLWATLSVPEQRLLLFAVMTAATAFVIPMAGPNVQATIMEISLPEIRSTASAVQNLMEGSGASLAPFLAGVVAVRSSLEVAIGVVSVVAWIVCGILFGLALLTVPKDQAAVRLVLRERIDGRK